MSDINHWLRNHPRSSARGAPMGHSDRICEDVIKELLSGSSHPVYVQRLLTEDGDYDLSGTYWGFGPDSDPVWCGYTMGVQGEHDNGIRIFVRAPDLEAAKAAIKEEIETQMGQEFEVDFRSPGEEAFYTEVLDSIHDLVQSYLDTARFTDMGPDYDIPEDLPFSKRAQFDAAVDIINFIHNARDDENTTLHGKAKNYAKTWTKLIEAVSTGKYSLKQLAGDIWYTRNGHGCGFWDRGLGILGDRLSEIAKGMGSASVFTNDNKIAEIE